MLGKCRIEYNLVSECESRTSIIPSLVPIRSKLPCRALSCINYCVRSIILKRDYGRLFEINSAKNDSFKMRTRLQDGIRLVAITFVL